MVQGVGQAVVGEVAHGEVEGARVQLELHPRQVGAGGEEGGLQRPRHRAPFPQGLTRFR